MPAARRRHLHHDEPENHERWLVSYADFITLLFAFFVVMYAISSVNAGKYRVLSENLIAAFRSPSATGGTLPIGESPRALSDPQDGRKVNLIAPDLRPLPTPPVRPDLRPVLDRPSGEGDKTTTEPAASASAAEPPATPAERKPPVADPLARIEAGLRNAVAEMIHFDQMAVRREKNWVELEIKDNLLFQSGSAQLNAQAIEPLKRIAGVLDGFPNRVQVEGFTDNVPIRNPVYPSNWELSAARAASVVAVLSDAGVAPGRMAAIGYGEFRPIGDNATPEGRLRNRRVVLVVLNQQADPRSGVEVDPTAAQASATERNP
ncbi:flagellar motor protein MotD [Plasticicumulans acidivorans]|uniref:Chemotaxis protein MotB n=1 Tax=Plasticicumulans acidivorans TaxID=886464 RepID=A0A317N1U7_9GAMM|nr:flagellar motor protein MotD [Plasticicumulans acidivorans]PWV63263.1 chemotaxis protein MotB [Plasticicumulans acidivorans]